MANQCRVTLATDPAQWDALFSKVGHPHMTQAWAYGEAKQAAGGREQRRVVFDAGGWRARRLVFEREGEPVAICQLLDKPLMGLRCASRLNRGPLLLGADPERDVVRDVYGALRSRWSHLRGVLVLAPALLAGSENCRMLTELGFRCRQKRGWRSARLDLRLNEEQLRANLRPTWRNRLRSSERSGLEVSVSQSRDDVEWMVERHTENMKEKGFAGSSPTLVRALCHAAPDDVFIFQARLGGALVGGMMVCRVGQGAEYFVGWMGAEGRKVNVGNFLYWQIALELQHRGYLWFDLGGTNRADTTGHFKEGMRGVDYELLNEWLAF